MAQLRSALVAVRRDLADIEGTATNETGTITATVDDRGTLRDLVLDQRVYRDADSWALAEDILSTIRAAVSDAAASAQRLTTQVLEGTR